MQTIGDRLAIARASMGWEQKFLADQFGCHATQISMWETGKRIPKLKAQQRLSELLRISAEWLRTGEGPMLPELDPIDSLIPATNVAAETTTPYKTAPGIDTELLESILHIVIEEGGNISAADIAKHTAAAYAFIQKTGKHAKIQEVVRMGIS